MGILYYLVIIISSLQFCSGEIKNTSIVDDSRPSILFERFGFAPNGRVSVSVSHVSWKSKHKKAKAKLNLSSMGFYLVRDSSYPLILNESFYIKNFCVLSSKYVTVIFTYNKLALDLTYNTSLIVDEPDEYNLIFGNCQTEFGVSMKVETEMYNTRGGERDFLPAGQALLPEMYFLLFLMYTSFLGIWAFLCFTQRQTVYKIHFIMAALLLFKALKVLCASEDRRYVSKTGSGHGWDVAFYIFGFFKGVTLFTVIVLIGAGWSFLKPYLQDRERGLLMFIIPLQVIENIAVAVIGETGPTKKNWFTWNEIFLMIDVMCCFAVFIPIVWSIRGLREASKTDGKAARNLRKLTLFKQFYIVLVAYLYFTRVVVGVMQSLISYRYEWVAISAAEGASLCFYLFVFYNFQPVDKNPYLAVDNGDELFPDDQLMEEDDSFEL